MEKNSALIFSSSETPICFILNITKDLFSPFINTSQFSVSFLNFN